MEEFSDIGPQVVNDNQTEYSSVDKNGHPNSITSFQNESLMKKFDKLGLHFVGYCLTQRFLQTFDDEGMVKLGSFIKDDASLNEYGLELYNLSERKRLSTEYV